MKADIRDKYFELMQEVQEKLKKLYGKEVKQEDDTTVCKHENDIIDGGTRLCKKCGETLGYLFDNDDIFERRNLNFRPYEKKANIRNILMRMSGHNYNEPKSVNIEEMPKGLKQIRKYLRTNNLNPKNDLYYYREKNNIEVKIPCSEIDVLGSAYNVFINQGGKMSPKDYIYHKLKNVDKYKELLLFVKKKTQED